MANILWPTWTPLKFQDISNSQKTAHTIILNIAKAPNLLRIHGVQVMFQIMKKAKH